MRELMPELQQSALPAHRLGQGQACTLAASPRPRWLLVAHGRVWLTGLPTAERGGDLWLGAGEWVRLPPGLAPVLEADGGAGVDGQAAAFLLLEATRPWAQRVRGGLAGRLRAAGRSLRAFAVAERAAWRAA